VIEDIASVYNSINICFTSTPKCFSERFAVVDITGPLGFV
jgi:hypothetical protein